MRAAAPGKIIFSGEHAVVYGKPALVAAVNRFAWAEIDPADDLSISFHLVDFNEQASDSFDQLQTVSRNLSQRHQAFLEGKLDISQVVQKPADLFAFLFIHFFEQNAVTFDRGLRISLRSDIPVGSGMGSSAATLLAVLRVMTAFYHLEFDRRKSYDLALTAEKLQHGRPSGVDPYVSLNGGFVCFQDQRAIDLPMPRLPFYLINTGAPGASTGECVSQVAQRFGASTIWNDFERTTEVLQHALLQNDSERVLQAVRDNHRLLIEIGVTPMRVQQFIAELEARDGAAKIAGAGSIRGDGGGMVIAFAETPPLDLVEKYGYTLMDVQGEPHGARLV